MSNLFFERLKNDSEFAKRISEAPSEEARQEIYRAEGYEVKGVRDFLQRLQEDADLMEKLSALETMDEKMAYIVEQGYYFTHEELLAEQERIAEEEFDTLSGTREAECGAIIEGHCGFTCEPEAWKRDSNCSSYFKCTWG